MPHIIKPQHLKSTQSQVQSKLSKQIVNKFSKSTNFVGAKSDENKKIANRKNCHSAKIRTDFINDQNLSESKSFTVNEMRRPSMKSNIIKKSILIKKQNLPSQSPKNQNAKKQKFMNVLRNQILKTKINIKSINKIITNDHNRSISQLDKEKDDLHFHYEVNSKINYNKIKTLGNQLFDTEKDLLRSRSKVINKHSVNQSKQILRTIEISQGQTQEQKGKSNLLQTLNDNNPKLIKISSQFVKYKPNQINIIDDLENSSNSSKSIQIVNTQIYECQINKLTNNFIKDWQGMNIKKQNTYKHLRNKLIAKFPSMKNKYPNHNNQFSDPVIQSKRHSSYDNPTSPKRKQSKMFSQQCKDSQRKVSINQQRILQQIYKQTYFWSRTKGKKMSIKFADLDQHRRQMQNLQRMKKSLTFMKYIKNKTSKNAIMQKSINIKGKNIMKKHDTILQIEKQGSKQQQNLMKCLDNAIEGCIRQSM